MNSNVYPWSPSQEQAAPIIIQQEQQEQQQQEQEEQQHQQQQRDNSVVVCSMQHSPNSPTSTLCVNLVSTRLAHEPKAEQDHQDRHLYQHRQQRFSPSPKLTRDSRSYRMSSNPHYYDLNDMRGALAPTNLEPHIMDDNTSHSAAGSDADDVLTDEGTTTFSDETSSEQEEDEDDEEIIKNNNNGLTLKSPPLVKITNSKGGQGFRRGRRKRRVVAQGNAVKANVSFLNNCVEPTSLVYNNSNVAKHITEIATAAAATTGASGGLGLAGNTRRMVGVSTPLHEFFNRQQQSQQQSQHAYTSPHPSSVTSSVSSLSTGIPATLSNVSLVSMHGRLGRNTSPLSGSTTVASSVISSTGTTTSTTTTSSSSSTGTGRVVVQQVALAEQISQVSPVREPSFDEKSFPRSSIRSSLLTVPPRRRRNRRSQLQPVTDDEEEQEKPSPSTRRTSDRAPLLASFLQRSNSGNNVMMMQSFLRQEMDETNASLSLDPPPRLLSRSHRGRSMSLDDLDRIQQILEVFPDADLRRSKELLKQKSVRTILNVFAEESFQIAAGESTTELPNVQEEEGYDNIPRHWYHQDKPEEDGEEEENGSSSHSGGHRASLYPSLTDLPDRIRNANLRRHSSIEDGQVFSSGDFPRSSNHSMDSHVEVERRRPTPPQREEERQEEPHSERQQQTNNNNVETQVSRVLEIFPHANVNRSKQLLREHSISTVLVMLASESL